MNTENLVKQFLQQHGRLSDLHAGARNREVTQAEIEQFRKQLEKVVQRNGALIVLPGVWVILLGGSAFGFALAYGGANYMSIYSSIASVLCLPIGLFLKSLWRDKFRAEVLLAILPLLSPEQALITLERVYYNDTTPATPPFAPQAPVLETPRASESA